MSRHGPSLAIGTAAAFVAAILAVPLLTLALSGGGGIVVGPNVTFRPSLAWADLSFSSQQTFQTGVLVGPRGVTFDNVTFGVQKLPAGLPRSEIVITGWAPSAGNGSKAIRFTATSDPGTTVWFNVTGLRADLSYEVYVDGVLQTPLTSAGSASFPWSAWSSHAFDLVAYVPTPGSTPSSQVTDLHLAEWGPNYAVLAWTAPGANGTGGPAAAYDVRYTPAGPLNATNFANATRIPTGTPKPAGSLETLNVTGLSTDTHYWFALRASYGAASWSALSNVAEVRTLASWVGIPSVEGVSYNPSQGQLQIEFSESMNQTSVEQSLTIHPTIAFHVTWYNGTDVAIVLQGPVQSNTTYFLTIDPHATDTDGNPMARDFTFKFTGLPPPGTGWTILGLPLALAVPLLGAVFGLAGVSVFMSVRLRRSEQRVQRLQGAVQTLTRRLSATAFTDRVRDLRTRLVPARPGQGGGGPPRKGTR